MIMEDRKQWFIYRIGKRVYRPKLKCECKSCQYIEANGLIIYDEMHAEYLYDTECIERLERFPDFSYSDTPFTLTTNITN